MKLILASSSPRRVQILRDAGFEFETREPQVDETRRAGESAGDYVLRLAEEKALAALPFDARISPAGGSRGAISPREAPKQLADSQARAAAAGYSSPRKNALVIGADTVIVVDGEIFGKPADSGQVRAMLRRLSGRTHEVLTGLAVVPLPKAAPLTSLETTRVKLAALSEQEIEDYIASGEPFGKAGAYAIQGRGGRFVERVEGCYFNVMGLPLARLYRLLREAGWTEPGS